MGWPGPLSAPLDPRRVIRKKHLYANSQEQCKISEKGWSTIQGRSRLAATARFSAAVLPVTQERDVTSNESRTSRDHHEMSLMSCFDLQAPSPPTLRSMGCQCWCVETRGMTRGAQHFNVVLHLSTSQSPSQAYHCRSARAISLSLSLRSLPRAGTKQHPSSLPARRTGTSCTCSLTHPPATISVHVARYSRRLLHPCIVSSPLHMHAVGVLLIAADVDLPHPPNPPMMIHQLSRFLFRLVVFAAARTIGTTRDGMFCSSCELG